MAHYDCFARCCVCMKLSLIQYTLFHHLIPLAWWHILYTLTSSLCVCQTDATPVCRETDTWHFVLVNLNCDGFILFVMFVCSHRYLGFRSEYTTVTDYHFHYSVLYVFKVMFELHIYLLINFQSEISWLCSFFAEWSVVVGRLVGLFFWGCVVLSAGCSAVNVQRKNYFFKAVGKLIQLLESPTSQLGGFVAVISL